MFLIEPQQRRGSARRADKAPADADSRERPKPSRRRQPGQPKLAGSRRLRAIAPALLCGGLGLVALPTAAAADELTADDLNKLRVEIQKEIAALKKQEVKLHQQFLELDRKSQLLDRKNALLDAQLRSIRATGTANAAPVGVGAPGSAATISNAPTQTSPPPSSDIEVAQAPAAAPSTPATAAPAPAAGGQAAPPPAAGESAPI